MFKIVIELKLGTKMKGINFDKGDEYYDRYDEASRNPCPFVRFFQDCKIEASYTMLRLPEPNEIVERRNYMLMDVMRCILAYPILPSFLYAML